MVHVELRETIIKGVSELEAVTVLVEKQVNFIKSALVLEVATGPVGRPGNIIKNV